MLDMGFIEDIRNILNSTPNNKQVSIFSATLNRSVMQICKDFMHYLAAPRHFLPEPSFLTSQILTPFDDTEEILQLWRQR